MITIYHDKKDTIGDFLNIIQFLIALSIKLKKKIKSFYYIIPFLAHDTKSKQRI